MMMKNNEEEEESNNEDHEHEHGMVMPGFRFHPTEEELLDFYLRRKVEGKSFHLQLITLLHLYTYDPWELPGLAAIGEKEWYFYVPRDRKYRNGDRPNRVTPSGYWKATGADRIIRNEQRRSIGLKKTLVFYSGKAPKGTRTAWIMNEYRLPQETHRLSPKAEICVCRVYKRGGVQEQYPSSSSSSRATSQPCRRRSSFKAIEQGAKVTSASSSGNGSSSSNTTAPLLPLPNHTTTFIHHHHQYPLLNQHHHTVLMQPSYDLTPNHIHSTPIFDNATACVDDLHKLVNSSQHSSSHADELVQVAAAGAVPSSPAAAAFTWDWNAFISEEAKHFTNL